MAYNGYLIQINGSQPVTDADFPNLIAGSYKVKKNIMDLEAYRDANGVLHRSALEHAPVTVSFQLDAGSTSAEIGNLMAKIRSDFKVSKERRVSITAYVPELDSYITQDSYMPDIEFPIDRALATHIEYDTITFEFIGY